jgi:small subunit ribosomal protein S9
MAQTKKQGRKKKYYYAVGRRKAAVATVKLFEGKGDWIVNGKPIKNYFPGNVAQAYYKKPLVVSEAEGKFHADVRIVGGGKASQIEAFVLAVSRALVKYHSSVYRPILKKAGFLTVDSRVKERRKAGQMGKARKKKQSPKR